MLSKSAIATAVVALGFSHAAIALTETDLTDLREQIRELKELYEKRIDALETRLRQAEQSAGKAETAAMKAEAVAVKAETAAGQAAEQAGSRPAGESAFNPGVSLILNGTYANLSRSPAGFRIDGFVPTLGEVAPPRRGPGLGESELVFSANVDPNFRGTLIAAVSPDDNTVGVEEGFIQTLGLSNGFTLKAGRFFSAAGYQNQVHAHAWDFADAPLANKVFLGRQLAEDGVQVKWVAPTDFYLDIGMELGRGRRFPGGPGGGRDKNGFGSAALFAHLGGDLGASTAWQLGLSQLRTAPEGRAYTDLDSTGTRVSNSFSAQSRLWVLDGVLKWAPNGNSASTSFKLQGEYFRRIEDGSLTYDTAAVSLGTQTGRYRSAQSGGYLQGVYQFMPRWRAGYRYDRLNPGSTDIGLVGSGVLTASDFPILSSYRPTRHSLMADWSASEFSRIRLQLARDNSRQGATDNQLFLQYIMSLGAHGAHSF